MEKDKLKKRIEELMKEIKLLTGKLKNCLSEAELEELWDQREDCLDEENKLKDELNKK